MRNVSDLELSLAIGQMPFWYAHLRETIAMRVAEHPLIKRVMRGNFPAVDAFLGGYAAYTCHFGGEIAERMPHKNAEVARLIGRERTVDLISAHLYTIRQVEGSHGDLWARFARGLGVSLPREREMPAPAMARLLELLRSADHARFYAALATTEAIACALAKLWKESPLYGASDPRWFEVHLLEHRPTPEDICRFIGMQILERSGESKPSDRFISDAVNALDLFVAVADELLRELTLIPA